MWYNIKNVISYVTGKTNFRNNFKRAGFPFNVIKQFLDKCTQINNKTQETFV